MELHYFPDTDTLSIALDRHGPVRETVDGPNHNIFLEFGEDDRLVGLTLEHASETTPLDALRDSPHFEVRGAEQAPAS
jgi:uncharacterized protein YuzE